MNERTRERPAAPKELEHDDPFELRGVVFPADEDTSREMARCFIEEFALLGFGRGKVEQLFRSPAYHGTWTLAQEHGDAFVRQLLDEVFGEEEMVDGEGS